MCKLFFFSNRQNSELFVLHSAGHLFAVLLGWWLLESYSWRVYLYVCSCFFVISVVFWFFIEESPRFLVLRDRHEEALTILRNVARRNGRPEVVSEITAFRAVTDAGSQNASVWRRLKPIFRGLLGRSTFTLMGVWLFGTIVYFGILVITPSYLSINDNEYEAGLVSTAAEVVGFIASVILVNYVPRIKLLMGFSAPTACILFVGSFFVDNDTVECITLVSARGFAMALVFLTYLYTIELYPTSTRNTALGIMFSVGKIGNIIASFAGEYTEASFFFPFITASMILCFLLCVSLPIETKDTFMPDRPNSPRAPSLFDRNESSAHLMKHQIELTTMDD
jgi:hypothetical protein